MTHSPPAPPSGTWASRTPAPPPLHSHRGHIGGMPQLKGWRPGGRQELQVLPAIIRAIVVGHRLVELARIAGSMRQAAARAQMPLHHQLDIQAADWVGEGSRVGWHENVYQGRGKHPHARRRGSSLALWLCSTPACPVTNHTAEFTRGTCSRNLGSCLPGQKSRNTK